MNFDILKDGYSSYGGTLIILVGPPGSGKSNIAEQIVENVSNYIIVSPDKVREELLGDSKDQSHNDEVFSRVYNDIVTNIEKGFNVVYDATNCRSQYRLRIIDLVRDRACRIYCIVSTTSLSECFKRNEKRDNVIPEDVIERMYFTLRKHPPTVFEGYDLIMTF